MSIFLYVPIHSTLVQTMKPVLHSYMKECFYELDSSVMSTEHDHFPIYSNQHIFLHFRKHSPSSSSNDNDGGGLFRLRQQNLKKKTVVIHSCDLVHFFVVSTEQNEDTETTSAEKACPRCTIWDVCTPLKYRKQHSFSDSMTYFLHHYASRYSTISLFVDPSKETYRYLLDMYGKHGFEIVDWSHYYRLTWNGNTTTNMTSTITYSSTFCPHELMRFREECVRMYQQIGEFHFQINLETNIVHYIPSLSYFKPTNAFQDTNTHHHWKYGNDHIYLYPKQKKKYCYQMKDFLFIISPNYFIQLFQSILNYQKRHTVVKHIHSHVLNSHRKEDLTPRFYLCLLLTSSSSSS